MRKISKILILLLMVFGLSSCGLFADPYGDSEDIKQLRENGQYIDISYSDLSSLYDTEKDFIFYIKREGCQTCFVYQDEISSVLKEDTNKKIYTLLSSKLKTEEFEALKEITYNVLGEDYYENMGWEKGDLYVPLTFQVVDGKISNGYCGFLAAKNLRNMYTFNFYKLDYYCNLKTKINEVNEFTLHMSTVTADEENTYLNSLYEEYKNDSSKKQGYYLNLYNLSPEEKQDLLQYINTNYDSDEMEALNELPSKFELNIKNGKVKDLVILE